MYLTLLLINLINAQVMPPQGILSMFNHIQQMMDQMDSPNAPRLRGFAKKITIHPDGSTTTQTRTFGQPSAHAQTSPVQELTHMLDDIESDKPDGNIKVIPIGLSSMILNDDQFEDDQEDSDNK